MAKKRSSRGRTIGTPTRVMTMGVTRKFKRQRRVMKPQRQRLIARSF